MTQEEALANADSATNLLWLLNNGPESQVQAEDEKKPAADQAAGAQGASFTEFTLDS